MFSRTDEEAIKRSKIVCTKETSVHEFVLVCQCYPWLIDVLVWNMCALIRIKLRDSETIYYSLTNQDFVSTVLIEKSVFGVIKDIVSNRIASNLSERLAVIPLWYGVEFRHIDT